LADALDMPSIIVPPFAGVLSAVGLALAPERHEAAASLLVPCKELTAARLAEAVKALASKVEGSTRRTLARVRYRGQGHELEIPLAEERSGEDGRSIAERFAAAHGERYGFTLPADAEVVALRHEAGEPARMAHFARDASRPAYDARQRVDAGGLADGVHAEGPTTIALPDATLFVADGWRAEALGIGGWRLTRVAKGAAS
jgi:N-methylhydantoinase A/oxoprolinase/acetone carboxylase beta subunit